MNDWQSLPTALQPYLPVLIGATEAVRDQDVSNYPILVAHQQQEEVPLGILVVAAQPPTNPWSVHISTLEELTVKKVVDMQRVDDFRKLYRERTHHLCLLVLSGETEARFAFVPRPDMDAEE